MIATCEQCHNPFAARKKRKFCSLSCAHEQQKRVVDVACEHCAKVFPTKAWRPNRFCSVVCAGLARRRNASCKTCGTPLRPRQAMYCSIKCAWEPRRVTRTCERCGNPVKLRRQKYCSPECAHPHKKCVVCGNPSRLITKRRLTCSAECSTARIRSPRNPLYTDELITRIANLASQNMTRREIGESVGLTEGQVSGLCERRKIKLHRRGPLPKPKPIKVVQPRPPVMRAYKLSTPKPKPIRTDRRESIPLREVYRLGSELGVPLSMRGDIHAVSRAMKAVDPAHPGFRLKEAVGWTTGTF